MRDRQECIAEPLTAFVAVPAGWTDSVALNGVDVLEVEIIPVAPAQVLLCILKAPR